MILFETLKNYTARTNNRQDNTTNSTVYNQRICSGWGFKTWNGSTQTQAEVITFPITFDDRPVVIMCPLGYKSSDPSHIGDFGPDGNNAYSVIMQATAISTTGFTAAFQVSQEVTPTNSTRNGYSWIAIGTKA